ncbi:MAG TPA: hypothetical protein VLD37_05480 [Candidatus Bilamarchaeum sp.]|nr:hypothetical protein [Candidatus Bilamarchaeum sp.]
MGLIEMWNEWVWLAGVAIGLSTALVALIYMLSELLQNDKMKGWAKMEFAEIFYSALIIAMAISGIQLVDAVVQGSLGVNNQGGAVGGTPGPLGTVTSAFIPTSDYGTFSAHKVYMPMDICGAPIASDNRSVYHGVESCHMRLGMWYLREVFDETKNFVFDIYVSYIRTSMISEFTINIEFLFEKAGFFTFTPWKGFFTIGNKVKEMVFDWAIKLMMVTKFQEVLLRFVATALFPALFVMGALLRTFQLTRKLGGLLLAIAISLYFIFPAFYAFGALIMLDLKNDPQIRNAWVSNSTINPQGAANPDPPIANTMYIRGDMPIPGGSGVVSTEEMRDRLADYEGIPSEQYFQYMEQGRDSGGNQMMQSFDLSSAAHGNDSEAQRNATFANAFNSVDSWFGAISKRSVLDNFVDYAWSPNGPLDVLARLTFWSVFFGLFSILGTIAGIRSLSITFGGDVEIAGLTRLI